MNGVVLAGSRTLLGWARKENNIRVVDEQRMCAQGRDREREQD